MKILFDKFNDFVIYKNNYYKVRLENKNHYENNKNKNIIIDLLKERFVEKCEEIIYNKLGDKFSAKDEDSYKLWESLHSYFCYPYKIYLYDDNNENFLNFEWKEDIFSITKEKLIEILKNSGRKYLKVKMNMGMSMWHQDMLEIEI